MIRLSTIGKRALPAFVSVAVLAFLVFSVDVDALLAALNWRVAAVMIPALIAYGAATLILESLTIDHIIDEVPEGFGLWTIARIKCASYLLGIVNYALGAASLAVLLRRRAGIGLGEAASLVLLISSIDMVVIMFMGGLGALRVSAAPTILIGLAVLAFVGFFGGLALLRMPGSLGPLDRIRSLAIFEAVRRLPLRSLLYLFFIRTCFASSFVGICAASFLAFDVTVPFVELAVKVLIVGVVAGIPIAVAGLGTSQAAFLTLFAGAAPEAALLAQSLTLSAGMLILRGLMGLLFAREFTQEALRETRVAGS